MHNIFSFIQKFSSGLLKIRDFSIQVCCSMTFKAYDSTDMNHEIGTLYCLGQLAQPTPN